MAVKITVIFKDGTNYSYEVKDVNTAKRYAHRITQEGFRIRKGNKMIYHPVEKIDTVEVEGSESEMSVQNLVEQKRG